MSIMIEHIESPSINGLQGYLQCIKRLCANGYVFGAVSYKANSDIDEFISGLVRYWSEGDDVVEPSNFEYCGKELISYEILLSKIEGFIFNGILDRRNMPNDNARQYMTKMLTEDINEYYGLLSVELNNDGVFHPLISNDVYLLNIRNEIYSQSFYYIVKIENVFVVTHFAQKANRGK